MISSSILQSVCGGFFTDLKRAARRLLTTPLFTIFAVLSLAVGVGVTTAVYSIVDSLFLKGSGVAAPERLVFIVMPYDGRILTGSLSQPDFEDFRAAQTSFSGLSASAALSPALSSSSTTELVAAEAVDGGYFATLGVTAVLGRTIQPADDAAGAAVVVLSHGLWRTRFAADAGIVGRTVRLGGHPFEVVGVAPAGFEGSTGLLRGTRLWIPLAAEASLLAAAIDAPGIGSARDRRRLTVFGRLAPSIALPTALAEIAATAARLDAAFPPRPRAGQAGPSERPWKGKTLAAITREDSIVRRFGLTLVTLVALVLVVACTNLANLVLARGTTRHQELTVRYALGASRWRLVREQCAESLLLTAGGAVAAGIVFQVLRVVMDTEFSLAVPSGGRVMLVIQPSLNVTALVVAGGSLLISLMVFGLEPALQLTRTRDLRGALLVAGAGGARGTGRQRMLLRWQVSISAGFFIIATMFARYTIAEARHDSGIEMERLGVAMLNFQTQGWDEARVLRTLDRVVEEARMSPDIAAVSVSAGLPFGAPGAVRLSLSRPELAVADRESYRATGVAATPALFRTLGVPILRGRGFDDRDQRGSAPVVVLSEFTARTLFGTIAAVGRHLTLRQASSVSGVATVVGVARNTDVGRLLGEPRGLVYMPLAQHYGPMLTLAARSTGTPAAAVRALREALRRVDPDVAVDAIGTGRSVLSGPFLFLRAAGVAALALGALTLLLAMVGLFGIQSHLVDHRTREIGVRMSLGASAAQIQRMVLKEGYRPVLEGLALGLFIGVVGRAIVRAYLEIDESAIDPLMLIVVPIPLSVAAFFACYLPAHRAAAVDPNIALRHL